MSGQNGSTKSPARTAARSVAGLSHDAVTLAELQAQLVKAELQQFLRELVVPAILLVVALSLALGCGPVLLLSLTYLLVEFAGLSSSLSALIAVLVGLAVAAVAAWVSWRRLCDSSITLDRSREEFSRNVRWLKKILKQEGSEGRHARGRQAS